MIQNGTQEEEEEEEEEEMVVVVVVVEEEEKEEEFIQNRTRARRYVLGGVFDAQEEDNWTYNPPNADGNSGAAKNEESRVPARCCIESRLVYPTLKSICCSQTSCLATRASICL